MWLSVLALILCYLHLYEVAAERASVLLVTGRSLAPSDGGTGSTYNATHETLISSQLISSFPNGVSSWWNTSTGSFVVGGEGTADTFRTLLRFDDAHRYVPAGAVVESAELTVTFKYPRNPILIQACFMTKPWSYYENATLKRASTGWIYSRWNGTGSVNWTQPGGWADCSPNVNISFVVPARYDVIYWPRTFQLDPRLVSTWLANNGSANYGLMFRGMNGTVEMMTSMFPDNMLRRPALTITYNTNVSAAPPALPYPVNITHGPRTWWVGERDGDDAANSGHKELPFRSVLKALIEAWPGDTVYLMNGTYAGSIEIFRGGITIQSAPGHWGVVASPRSHPRTAGNVFTVYPGADYGVFSDFEISGGHWYGVMFQTNWQDWNTPAYNAANATAPSHWVFRNMRIHGTGSNAIKLSNKATNITFTNCEIYDAGFRLRTYGNGIEARQTYDLRVTDCYFHDLPGAAVLLAAGSARVTLERNYIARTSRGLELGSYTEAVYMDTINNPKMYEAINVTATNNIMNALAQAGVVMRAAYGCVVAHNTIWRAQETGQTAILIDGAGHWPTSVYTASTGLVVWANVVVRSEAAAPDAIFQIRDRGLDNATAPSSAPASAGLVMAYNVYYDQAGLGLTNGSFLWGRGAMLEDERAAWRFLGNASGWARHCSVDMRQPLCDVGSVEANPLLNSAFTPQACSPARNRAPATMPAGVAAVTTDFHGRARPVGQARDAGAVQYGASGNRRVLPPVPAAFAKMPVYKGPGLPATQYDAWPFYYWQSRVCMDLVVDCNNGTDNQAYDVNSGYQFPFATLGGALSRSNMCDRILLRGGQSHVGFVTLTKTNVTVTTHPADLATGKRATVACDGASGAACVYFDGATALSLSNIDVVMSNGASGPCMQLNAGGGSGSSPWWDFFVTNSGRVPKEALGAAQTTQIANLTLSNCGSHGIKLSTFVRRVSLDGLNITGAGGSGIEMVGGIDVVIRRCRVVGSKGSGIRLGGGVRNVLAERNYVRDYGGVGIFLGSEITEVSYMDTDWPVAGAVSPPDWHDCVNATVRNNIVHNGVGAGVSIYSARDCLVAHNTFLNVSSSGQAAVLLNVSPKQTGLNSEVGPPNVNITFANNIVTLPAGPFQRLAVQARMLQGLVVQRYLNITYPNSTCPSSGATGTAGRRQLLMSQPLLRGSQDSGDQHFSGDGAGLIGNSGSADTAAGLADDDNTVVVPVTEELRRRMLLAQTFTAPYVNAQGTQGRNKDGSCPYFPDSNPWHQDISAMKVHPRSEQIKLNIGTQNLHLDFGPPDGSRGQEIPAGMPINIVDSRNGPPRVQIDFGSSGYGDPNQLDPLGTPLPDDAAIEGSFPGCGDPPGKCGGDRHLILVDNATCTLYEGYRSFPPNLTGTGRWRFEAFMRYNLLNNSLGHALGDTSADAAGLPILPALVTFDEVVNKGVVNHALRFTGPCSRRAYAMPATHFASVGDCDDRNGPYMGMRVRLKASYNCSALARAARIVCVALQKYGAFFADNGPAWDFEGEATPNWYPYWTELKELQSIPSSEMEVLDPGCICVDDRCTLAECNGLVWLDPNVPATYPAIANNADVKFSCNLYFKTNGSASFADQRLPPFGTGYSGGLAGWMGFLGEKGSREGDPGISASTYYPKLQGNSHGTVPRLSSVKEDFTGRSRGGGTNTDAGAVLY